MSEQIASHSEDVQEEMQDQQNGLTDEQYAEIMGELGYEVDPKTASKQQEDLDDEEEPEDEDPDADDDAPPATEEHKNVRKVKFNKQEVEISEDQIDELLQKGLALEKERARKSESEKALQRAAKLAGYDNVDDYLANLDKLEQDAIQKQKDHFAALKQRLREDAEENGLDSDLLEEFLENHPILQQANEVLSRQEQEQDLIKQQEAQQSNIKAWEALFEKYPSLTDEVSEDGGSAPWMTEDFISRINKGYDPVDAYEIVYRDQILAEERKRAEQSVKKQNRLNKRAKVEGKVSSEQEEEVPENIKGAFAEFGLDPRTAKKFMTRK